ncbi:MAG: DUF1302 family protein [Methylococcales bacterium]
MTFSTGFLLFFNINRARLNNDAHDIDCLSSKTFNQTTNRSLTNKILIFLILVTVMNKIKAAGIAVLEQSVSGLGNAYAGGTAGGEDISTIFYNPAALSEYAGTEIISGGHLVIPNIRFKTAGSSDLLNRPLTGGSGGKAGNITVIPNLYLATDLAGPFRFGLGITVPFGLGAKYNKHWQGRYEAINSQLQTVDINPAISYALNDKVSLGFGFSAQYIDVELTNALDFGSICFGQLGTATCSELGLSPQVADGKFELKADGWSWGYNAGVLFKPVPNIRFGIAYRSKIDHRVKGDATFRVPDSAQPLTATGAFINTSAKAESTMPASLSIGAIYEPNQQWAMLLDVTWTQWNKLDSLTTHFDNPDQPPSTLNLDFKNTIRAALGLTYHINPAWSIRTGFSYDESPVRNARTRTFRIPDNDRYWLAIGLGYRLNSNFKFNLAYAHVFIKDGRIDNENRFGHSIEGTIESQIDIVSAELQWTF